MAGGRADFVVATSEPRAAPPHATAPGAAATAGPQSHRIFRLILDRSWISASVVRISDRVVTDTRVGQLLGPPRRWGGGVWTAEALGPGPSRRVTGRLTISRLPAGAEGREVSRSQPGLSGFVSCAT